MARDLRTPSFPEHGHLRLYHMQPYRRYTSRTPSIGIDDMTAYVPAVASMGFNAIWGGPFQATGTLLHPHPDGKRKVSGSLYAMADDEAFNPLIFPDCGSREACEEKLRIWTATIRLHGIFPLFDLVLNHIGKEDLSDRPTPLQEKLGPALILKGANARWPDIQGLDYYREDATARGTSTEPKDLDEGKIDLIFKKLWEPFIRRYIIDYGFMGARIDAISHVPVPVLKRANDLIKSLVYEKFKTDAIILGELMVSQPESIIPELSGVGFTHCLNPSSFFWGPASEGGYDNSPETSSFLKQNSELATLVLAPPPLTPEDFTKPLLISPSPFDTSAKLQPSTIYIWNDDGKPMATFNHHATDICWHKAFTTPLSDLDEGEKFLELLERYRTENGTDKRTRKREIDSLLKKSASLKAFMSRHKPPQANLGGLVGVVGNHDVGTLMAKVLLDTAKSYALHHVDADVDRINRTYKEFKNIIKGVPNLAYLIRLLQDSFHLNGDETKQLFVESQIRRREKIFIQAMMSGGGFYLLAGDEVGVCHKPEVFREYAENAELVGCPIQDPSYSENPFFNLGPFIQGINRLCMSLPKSKVGDISNLYSTILTPPIFGIKAPDLLLVVTRKSAYDGSFHILVHSNVEIDSEELMEHLYRILSHDSELLESTCRLEMIDTEGRIQHMTCNLKKKTQNATSCDGATIPIPRIQRKHAELLMELGMFESTPSLDDTIETHGLGGPKTGRS